MDDFYMQSEINERERQIRQRQSTPHADEAKRPLLAPVSGLFARAFRLRLPAIHRTSPSPGTAKTSAPHNP